MKLKQLATGVATGYVTKAVQFVASLALVPFLLRPEVLGVDDYGRVFTLIAYMGIGTVVTAGIRLAFLRSISQGVGDDPDGARRRVGQLIGSGTLLLLVICGVLAAVGVALEDALLEFVRLPATPAYRTALRLALIWMTAENALFLFRGPLMARGAISYVNFVTMAEVLLRVGTLVWLLPSAHSPITVFLAVHAGYAVVRSAAYVAWSLVRAPLDLRGLLTARTEDVWSTVLYSRSITLSEAASFLVLRAPVVLAARALGPTEAGFIAIVINTIHNYIQQILFTVVQPLAVPIAARFDPRRISASARGFFYDLEGLYCATVVLVIAAVTVLAPDLIRLWLGEGYDPIVAPAQAILAACGIEIAYSIRKSLLIGQGLLPEAIGRISAMAVVTTAIVWVCIVVEARWSLAVYATAGYLAASSVFGIGTIWSRHFAADDDEAPSLLRFFAFVPSFAVAIAASTFVAESPWTVDLLIGAGVVVWTLACVGLFVIPIGKIGATVRRLAGAMDRDLFSA